MSNGDIIPIKWNSTLGKKNKKWNKIYNRKFFGNEAKFNELTTDILNVNTINTSNIIGQTGPQGPGLFTLLNLNSFVPVTLTSNSITTPINISDAAQIKIVEQYRTAFITFYINILDTINNPFSIGFVNISYLNTFAFGFQFNNDTDYSLVFNGAGSVGSYNYITGDQFTISLLNNVCYYYQNGNLIAQCIINNIYGQSPFFVKFYLTSYITIDKISFSYLNDNHNTLCYTYNTSNYISGDISFLYLADIENTNTIYYNCILNSSYAIRLPTNQIYEITISFGSNSLNNNNYSIYYSYDTNSWTAIGNIIPQNIYSGSSTVMLNTNSVSSYCYIGIGTTSSISSIISGTFNISINTL